MGKKDEEEVIRDFFFFYAKKWLTKTGVCARMMLGGVYMMEREEKVRKNLTMSKQVAAWYEKRAKEMGISQSALMVMVLANFAKQEGGFDDSSKK